MVLLIINILSYLIISIPISKVLSKDLDWRKNSSISFKFFSIKNFFIQILSIIFFGLLLSLFDLLLIIKYPKGLKNFF
jgi:hypothetical protein